MNVKDLKLRAVKAYKPVMQIAGQWVTIGYTYANNLFAAYERARMRYAYVPAIVPVEG